MANPGFRLRVLCHHDLAVNDQLYFKKDEIYKIIWNPQEKSDVKYKVENNGVNYHCTISELSRHFAFVDKK